MDLKDAESKAQKSEMGMYERTSMLENMRVSLHQKRSVYTYDA